MSSINTQLVEALIFASPEPVDAERLADIIGNVTHDEINTSIDALNRQYEESERSFSIVSGGGGFRFATRSQFSKWVRKLVIGSGRLRMSRAALETLSLIAYQQPVSRSRIEAVRGVDAGGVLKMLLERRLVMVRGRGPGPGRPLLYVTTPDFLTYFGLDSLDDLPKPEELVETGRSIMFEDISNDINKSQFEENSSENVEASEKHTRDA